MQQGQVYLFDGLIPSRHGPRVLDVLEGLAEAMHPEKFPNLAPPGTFRKATPHPNPLPKGEGASR